MGKLIDINDWTEEIKEKWGEQCKYKLHQEKSEYLAHRILTHLANNLPLIITSDYKLTIDHVTCSYIQKWANDDIDDLF